MDNADKNLQKSENLIYDIFEYLPAFICVVHIKDGVVIYGNHMAKLIFNDKIIGCKLKDLMDFGAGEGDTSSRNTFEYDKCIKEKWYHITDTSIDWLDGEPSRMILGFDITKIKISEKKFSLEAKLDLMTGIYNRQTGIEFLNQHVEEVRHFGHICTVCYMDMNDLKFINDYYGHSAGDDYIMAVVSSIKSSIRRTDIFARMGGDEFLIIFPNCRYDIVENIMSIVNNKLELMSATSQMPHSVSYGIMEVNSETVLDPEYIFNSIDNKMYYMKEEYKKNRKLPDINEGVINY